MLLTSMSQLYITEFFSAILNHSFNQQTLAWRNWSISGRWQWSLPKGWKWRYIRRWKTRKGTRTKTTPTQKEIQWSTTHKHSMYTGCSSTFCIHYETAAGRVNKSTMTVNNGPSPLTELNDSEVILFPTIIIPIWQCTWNRVTDYSIMSPLHSLNWTTLKWFSSPL